MRQPVSLLLEETGQGLTEYAFLLMLIAVLVISGVSVLGLKIKEVFTQMAGMFP